MSEGDLLHHAAAALGIETDYVDAWGAPRAVPEATVHHLAAALGLGALSEDAIEEARSVPWRAMLDPVHVVRSNRRPTEISVVLPADLAAGHVSWTLEFEDGAVRDGGTPVAALRLDSARVVDGRARERRSIAIDEALPTGYHRLRIDLPGAGAAEALLIASPGTGYVPPALDTGSRCWGAGLQLYALRSRRNWGIGDFTDLARLAKTLARFGCDAIGLNPLHAQFPGNPAHASPYSPTSRRFGNVLYLDVEAVADLQDCADARRLISSAEFQDELKRLRGSDLVDYVGVAEAKLPVLEMLFDSFAQRHLGRGTRRERDFRRFVAERGEPLRRFTAFETLAEHFGAAGRPAYGWRDWPERFRAPDSPAVAAFVRDHAGRVDFHRYLQWNFEHQFARAARVCERAGMVIGLYQDLAVGFDAAGADAWADQRVLVDRVQIGAPPDPMNLHGQNWGVPPFHPDRLREAEYAPLIETLRANMRNGGALRIDHVLGLERLYWIPYGHDGTEGGYVRNRFEELLAIIMVESVRNRCLVIGEDLGTVPRGFRARLNEAQILSYRLVYFERDETGRPLPPEDYPTHALASIGTHDLPTLAGFWTGHDIDMRDRLDLFPTPEMALEARLERRRDRVALIGLLKDQGLYPAAAFDAEGNAPPPPALVEALYTHLARTPAMLVIAHPDDALGVLDQVNMPGTVDEHPNWRRKLPLPREAFGRDRRLKSLFESMDRERKRR